MALLAEGQTDANLSVIPPEVFDICTPTQGSLEVIKPSNHVQWYALDIISTASIVTFAFSIDEHPLWIYAVDGRYIEPLQVDAVTISNGERYSVFIKLDKPGGNYGIRAANIGLNQLIDTTAVLTYDAYNGKHDDSYTITSTPYTNQAGLNTSADVVFFNQAQMVSFPPAFPQPAPEASQTIVLSLQSVGNSYTWTLNGTALSHSVDNIEPPLLYQAPTSNGLGTNVTIETKNGTWVDLILRVVTPSQPPHPIHKHSNKGFLIGQGITPWNYTSVTDAVKSIPQNFNLAAPPYRDVFTTIPTSPDAPETWIAVRYQVINPGPFMLHCHIQSHLNGGMAMVILDGVDEWPHLSSGGF